MCSGACMNLVCVCSVCTVRAELEVFVWQVRGCGWGGDGRVGGWERVV